MPINVAPPFRALEEALEANGLIQNRDSVGVDLEEAKEAGGFTRVLPKDFYVIRGTVYTPGSIPA